MSKNEECWTVEDARRVFRKEMALADACLATPGLEKQGQMLKGQRYAIDDVENERLTAEIAAMWARLKGLA